MTKHIAYILLSLIFSAYSAFAQVSCNVTVTDMDFGSINVTTGAAFTTAGTMTVNCTGTAGANVRICASIGSGSAASTSYNPRSLASGANLLNFNLYTTNTYTNIWGSFSWPWASSFPGKVMNLVVGAGGSGTTSAPIYGRVLAGQTTKVPGTYTSSFASPHIRVRYDTNSGSACSTLPPINTAPVSGFNVSATVIPACTVTASNLDFGSVENLLTNINSSSSIISTCTNSTPYTISLDGGLTGATSPTARKMDNGNGQQITYGLYRDSLRTLPWGNTIGSNTAAGTGSGGTQSTTVYGRVPPQTTPISGVYTDTITVTLTY